MAAEQALTANERAENGRVSPSDVSRRSGGRLCLAGGSVAATGGPGSWVHHLYNELTELNDTQPTA
jgi:hypothetical protein